MIALLGFTVFELLTGFTSDSSVHTADYAKHNVIAGKPRLQAMGNDLSSRRITIRLHHKIASPELTYQTLRHTQQSQNPVPLVFGSGQFDGLYVIKTINDTKVITSSGGTVLARELSLELTEYPMTADTLLSMIAPTNLLGIMSSVGQLPIGAISNVLGVTQMVSDTLLAVRLATATYRLVCRQFNAFVSLFSQGNTDSDTATELALLFANLATQGSALKSLSWDNDWLNLGDSVNDFIRFNAQASNQYHSCFEALTAGNTVTMSSLNDVQSSLSAAAKGSEKMTAWISIRGGLNG